MRPLHVLDVELSRPPEPLGVRADVGGVQALIRWHGIPLGPVTHPAPGAHHGTADLAARLTPRQRRMFLRHRLRAALQASWPDGLRLHDVLRSEPPVRKGPYPSVTVAVCTRDRATDLALCLDALLELDYPALDLLVVDNAPSTETTARLIATRYPTIRYVCEPRPGLDWARNRAIRAARGEILAFTDDDALVDRVWVRALADVFMDDPAVMVVTGLVVPHELQTEAQQRFERYGGFGRGYEREWHCVGRRPDRADSLYIGTGLCGTGANMAFRTRVFETVGDFDPALDVGTVTQGGGDLDMFFRVLRSGLTLVYEPAAIVRHRHRRTEAELRQQIVGWGRGFYAYLTRIATVYPEMRGTIVRFGLWYFWRRYLRRLGLGLVAPAAVPRRLMLAELRGALTGPVRYRRARAAAARIAASPGDPM